MNAVNLVADASRLVSALRDPHLYPHPAKEVELVETHISWVLLAGDYAYKLKKPLDLGFLDFTTLALRKKYCEEELRLNRRLAPELYLDVVAITGTIAAPRVGGEGDVLDYAVRMRRFDRNQELGALLARGALPPERIDELAATVARFHAQADAAAADGPYGTPEAVLAPCLQNFDQLEALVRDPADVARIERLRAWTVAGHARLAGRMRARLEAGRVRECHGDLHLGNMVLHEGRVAVFDCIEFNPEFRWTDVAAEIAFTMMDLAHRGRRDYAQRFLDDWLASSGDYDAVALLPFYLVYRAMVRAKVAAIRESQRESQRASQRGSRENGAGARADQDEFHAHLALAEAFAAPRQPALLITCGVSGSGKSYVARKLVESGDWVRVRSDVERKRLAGLAATARSGSGVGTGLYAADLTAQTYARLLDLGRAVLAAGYPVILDATFLKRERREAARALAAECDVPFVILAADAPGDVLRARVKAREKTGADPSEATLAVLERQLATREALDPDEIERTVRIDTRGAIDVAAVAAAIAARGRRR